MDINFLMIYNYFHRKSCKRTLDANVAGQKFNVNLLSNDDSVGVSYQVSILSSLN